MSAFHGISVTVCFCVFFSFLFQGVGSVSFISMAGIEEGRVDLPRVCEGCYMSYGDFVTTYYEDCEAMVKLLVKHGLLPEKSGVFITEATKIYPPPSP